MTNNPNVTAQPCLPFAQTPLDFPFTEGDHNHEALSALTAWRERLSDTQTSPTQMIAVQGSAGNGKTRLARELVDAAPMVFLIAPDVHGQIETSLAKIAANPAMLVVDDTDKVDALALVSLYNDAKVQELPVVFIGRNAPDNWGLTPDRQPLRDMVSRFASIPHVEVNAPDAFAMAKALQGGLAGSGLFFTVADIQATVTNSLRRQFIVMAEIGTAIIETAQENGLFGKDILSAAMTENRHLSI